MSLTRNATDFESLYKKLRADYEQHYNPIYDKIREVFAKKNLAAGLSPAATLTAEDELNKGLLEAQFRLTFFDPLLNALNWYTTTAKLGRRETLDYVNTVIEPQSHVTGNQWQYFDYLGFEQQGTSITPLMLFEAKRPSEKLPATNALVRAGVTKGLSEDEKIVEIIAKALRGAQISGPWKEHVTQLQGYVKAIFSRTNRYPKKVAITNGEWLLIFTQPDKIFSDAPSFTTDHLMLFSSHAKIESNLNKIFDELAYINLRETIHEINIGEIGFKSSQFDYALRGLYLIRHKKPSTVFSGGAAEIIVSPMVFLHSINGSWSYIRGDKEFDMPGNYADLKHHLQSVQQYSDELFQRVEGYMTGGQFQPQTLNHHYGSVSFEDLKSVIELKERSTPSEDHIYLVTGEFHHFILPNPTNSDCLTTHHYYQWSSCNSCGVANTAVPIVRRDFDLKSFFRADALEMHHCAHQQVTSAKSHQIPSSSSFKRSRSSGEAFCEIWPFEQYLCCRTCIFQDVCLSSGVFNLPCQPQP